MPSQPPPPPFITPTGFPSALLYNIQDNGNPRLVIAMTDNQVYFLDPTSTTDVQNAGASVNPIVVTLKTPWLYFGDSTSRKDFNEIEILTTDPNITLTLEGASNSGEFAAPTVVLANLSPTVSPFGERKFYIAGYVTKDRFYRLTFKSTDLNTRAVLDAWKAELYLEHKF